MVPNLLITDDDAALRGVLSDALTRSGFCVHQAADGQQALHVLGDTEIHFALVDVHMPRVTGLELLRRLGDVPKRPPCALMSADWNDEIEAEARRFAAYKVVHKPVRLGQIRGIVADALLDVYGWKPA
ncbi:MULTISPECIES: response regulator [Crateriforma]|uniref:Sporulation initiation phosphotransferase F n=1 Tax=Crateriforma conspicua TaxID=2527996 RepID=A0A5C6FVE4_9PLAN|nr:MULTISPECIES: response regulator [Crateriforma]QDV63621.1 Sporulation initiation phosphotransferase F [Crateriforma conspicua]TWT68885.1 Sporulation initiation phosphotransferase F [Crateriforma conspicua]TWU67062.1 Sporulation initiation phosphotransferase F [Crateriforma conspicua]